MSGSFSVTALAIAVERANAIGVVRLTCLPEGLEIELVRASAFAVGFAPPVVAERVSFTVPYTAVRGLVRSGRALSLALDPVVATPHNRFALVRFTGGAASELTKTYRARLVARALSYFIPAPAGILAAFLVPRSLAGGALGSASLGFIVAVVAWAALEGFVRWITWGGPASDALRDAFESHLSSRLGLVPAAASVSPMRLASSRVAEDGHDDLRDESRGRRLAVVGVVAAAIVSLVGVMAFLKRFAAPSGRDADARTRAAEIAVGLGGAPSVLARLELLPLPDDRPRCTCQRADSPLWRDGVPALSVLLFARPDDGSGVVAPILPEADAAGEGAAAEEPARRRPRRGRGRSREKSKKGPRFDFDLAVVNNTSRPMRDVRVVLTFARRDRSGERVGVTDRGLFWGGDLAPGRAVKWHVRAPGTEMRVETSVAGALRDGDEEKGGSAGENAERGASPASPDAFYALLSSRYRVVRIHGAKMLAYLRDPRAESALGSLGAASTVEAPIIAQIRRASRSIVACDVKSISGDTKGGAPALGNGNGSADNSSSNGASAGQQQRQLEACVFNAGLTPAEGVSLREILPEASDPAALGAGAGAGAGSHPEKKSPLVFSVEGLIPVHEGIRVSFPLDETREVHELSIEQGK